MDSDIELRARIAELTNENRVLREQLEGNFPSATYWLQTKVWRQREALDVLNRRVVNQRLALRTINDLGRGLTDDEWQSARESVTDGRAARLDDKQPTAA